MNNKQWQFWIDRGGTFTDIVAQSPDGNIIIEKLLSVNPKVYSDAAIAGIRSILNLSPRQAIPSEKISAVKMGTTVATNALLERHGEPTVLFITQGFRDALRIAYQNRPDIFAKVIQLPDMIYADVYEVPERVDVHGHVVIPIELDTAKQAMQKFFDEGYRSIAIVLMHSYRYPDHELALRKLARDIGFSQISVSHQISPLIKLVMRGDTTAVDAYLTPILQRYINQVRNELGDTRLYFMQSNGGLASADNFNGKDSILSGPAGGVVGAIKTSEAAGIDKVIAFDMGGTSTDVSHFAGEYERSFSNEVAGVRIHVPMMNIHTIAAGGGSILHFDEGRFQVGPDSAGADPGPACYRNGGPLTVTDANVMLGKIQADYFPKLFGDDHQQAIDGQLVAQSFNELAHHISKVSGGKQTAYSVAEGFIRVAVDNMANAIKKISIQRGYDVSRYTLSCLGGAAGQHACLIAEELGIEIIFIHPHVSVLSAYGIGLADIRSIQQCSLEENLSEAILTKVFKQYKQLEKQCYQELQHQVSDPKTIVFEKKIQLKYQGTDVPLLIDFADDKNMLMKRFHEAHQQRYGFTMDDKPCVIEALFVEGNAPSGANISRAMVPPKTKSKISANTQFYSKGNMHQAQVYQRDEIAVGEVIVGPALIVENNSVIVIEPNWQVVLDEQQGLILTRTVKQQQKQSITQEADPILLEVFNNLFMNIAEQMGVMLANTAYSVNIKERLDFSCAIFDADGSLVANAPHIPVHLGSMGESVRAIIHSRKTTMQTGDVFTLNNPYNGGTHLPDITVITPVFDTDEKTIIFYVASRGHHADIGGKTPGSIPPDSQHIDEEGILIDDFQLVAAGKFCETEFRELLLSGKYPVRNVEQNIADIKAQVAANHKGVLELKNMVQQYGLDVVHAYMQHIQDNAAQSVRNALAKLQSGEFSYEMDNGCEIHVKIDIDKQHQKAVIDFTGSSPQSHSNFNAPSAVCRAAVLYVLRTLIEKKIPLNDGCLKPIELIIPEKSLLNPQYPAAVVAGNVETSQCVVDSLYGALNVLAASQGTMNNFTFGNAQYQYYETICGGSGAAEGYNGVDAIHTHMTNTHLTDPEVLELRFPVFIESFGIRQNSGGKGCWHGGNGVIRKIKFLEPMQASILSNHRRIAPFGLAGGGPAKIGKNYVIRQTGTIDELTGTASVSLNAGDIMVIETPGGGGYGGSD